MQRGTLHVATIGGGCFWCLDAIFKTIRGVETVISGYSGGNVPGVPTYREVCSGLTRHAEVVQLTFDPEQVSYKDLITIFMLSHDPTVANLEPTAYGSQYRSVIFYHSHEQQQQATAVITDISSDVIGSITTEVVAASVFHAAEEYHQDYFNKYPTETYCSAIIAPKLKLLQGQFTDKLKRHEHPR